MNKYAIVFMHKKGARIAPRPFWSYEVLYLEIAAVAAVDAFVRCGHDINKLELVNSKHRLIIKFLHNNTSYMFPSLPEGREGN